MLHCSNCFKATRLLLLQMLLLASSFGALHANVRYVKPAAGCAPAIDHEGNSHPADSGFDMKAYEFHQYVTPTPIVFGNNVWHVYAWNAGGATINPNAWNLNYAGYYVDNSLYFNTSWDQSLSPSHAPGYVGDPVQNDNHSWSAMRKGFPAGNYTLQVTGHDDAAQLFINGTKVWEHNGCCDSHNNVWQGNLDANA